MKLVISYGAGSLLLVAADGSGVKVAQSVPLSAKASLEDLVREIRPLGIEQTILTSSLGRAVAALANDFDARRADATDVTRVAVHRLRAVLGRFRPLDLGALGVDASTARELPAAAAALDSVMEVLGIETAKISSVMVSTTAAPARRPSAS